ncbi:MAG: hypothetical protein AUJ47_11230 [Candidatus Marinimicrobia bacterium CG1_02_48_14]|nr:MAG: hypothetical protein AUJ47_11230 [Candidatus Marinimicrobia bacterium CG1_02_48_14]
MQNGEKWAVRGFMNRLDAADQILVGYNILALVLVLLAPLKIPHQGWLFLFHLVIQAAWVKLSQFPGFNDTASDKSNGWIILHAWIPILIIIPFYSEATFLSHYFIPGNLDEWLYRTDLRLFGFDLNHALSTGQPLWLNEFFHGVYFSYYGLMVYPAVLLYRESILRFRHYLAGLILLLMVHNLLFVFLPAAGPVHLRVELFPAGTGLLFIPLMNWIYGWGDYAGAAIPSAHVAASIFIFLSLRNQLKQAGQTVLAIWILAIFGSTVYCSYHYGIDVISGICTGLIFYGMYLKWPWLQYKPQQNGGIRQPTTSTSFAPFAPDSAD